MRASPVHVVQAELIALNSTAIPLGPISATLRVGRNHTTRTVTITQSTTPLQLGLQLTLNIESPALQHQRCTITLNKEDKSVIGVALISLPEGRAQICQKYRLNRSIDKEAELSVRLSIRQLERGGSQDESEAADPETTDSPLPPRNHQRGTKSSLRQPKSSDRSHSQQQPTQNQVLESQLVRLKKQKEVYYQLYQIERSKSEIAAKFITHFISTISTEYPELWLKMRLPTKMGQRRKIEGHLPKGKQDSEARQKLKQAKQSLQKQVQQYKRSYEQLSKQVLGKSNTRANNLMGLGGFEDLFPNIKGNRRAGSETNILAQVKREVKAEKCPFIDVSLSQWLEESAGQRQQLHQYLLALPMVHPHCHLQSQRPNFPKLKCSVNKIYLALLSKGIFDRKSILDHKRQLISLLDQQLLV